MRGYRLLPLGLLSIAALCSLAALTANATPPVVSNVRAAQRPGTHCVDIYYNVSDADGNSPLTVYLSISANGGTTWNVPVFTTSGAIGPGVTLGSDRHIVWDAGADWPGQFNSQCKVRIVADDGTAPPAPAGMAYVPGGTFTMGDAFSDGFPEEKPQHTVLVTSFFMDKNKVTGQLWQEVKYWAITYGYGFDNAGSWKGTNHPVQTVSWYDVAKWCNLRSEREGLVPCYYTDASQTVAYRSGLLDLTNACVKWSASGYRLPTEAEWEKAARGGLNGRRFPWGDTIDQNLANYFAYTNLFSYDVNPTQGYNAAYATNATPYTSPVGSFAANGYGLTDMAGNAWDWCWDWVDVNWYANSQAAQDDTHGPSSALSYRSLRGGGWVNAAPEARSARRGVCQPSCHDGNTGFRCVRGL